ncbi:uncharacterized protein TNCV_2058621 [Trichonephila clavipes]|nr:uncharacterized protein TNCV_2058621 [Trichonephila clavipes]
MLFLLHRWEYLPPRPADEGITQFKKTSRLSHVMGTYPHYTMDPVHVWPPFPNWIHFYCPVAPTVIYSTHILFKSIKEDSSRRFTLVDASLQCMIDQIDAFPEHISTTVVPVTLPEKPDALEYAARQGQLRACIICEESNTKRVFVLFCKDNWYQKRRWWIISSVPSWRQST